MALAEKDAQARQISANQERWASRVEGLQFKAEMLEEEIEWKRKQLKEVKEGRRLASSSATTESVAQVNALVIKQGMEIISSDDEVPRVIAELCEHLKDTSSRLKQLKDEQKRLEQALTAYAGASQGPSREVDGMIQSVIHEAQEVS